MVEINLPNIEENREDNFTIKKGLWVRGIL
jgi:hypothetical protein